MSEEESYLFNRKDLQKQMDKNNSRSTILKEVSKEIQKELLKISRMGITHQFVYLITKLKQ